MRELDVPDRLSRYLSPRGGSNLWSESDESIAAWRRRDLLDVRPLTLEFSPVLDCNADCPLCPYRRSRLEARTPRWNSKDFARPNERTVASRRIARRVLTAAETAGVRGVLWTGGGEPTLFEPLAEMCELAGELGMVNGIYTNGFLLGAMPELAERLLAPEARTVFVRVSINAVSPNAVTTHWGITDPTEVYQQLRGLENLLAARERMASRGRFHRGGPGWSDLPSLQVSTIVDRRNVDDLPEICRTVTDIFRQYRQTVGPEDIMVVRPTVDHRRDEYSFTDHGEGLIHRILNVCGEDGSGRTILEQVGLPLVLGFGLDQIKAGVFSTYEAVIRRGYEQRDRGWASGLFLTVGPDASVYPCMEMNCEAGRSLGNLMESCVEDIYHGTLRQAFVAEADRCGWGPKMFHPHSRTARLDRIAAAIMTGELTDKEIQWIRARASKSHSLLLN